MDAQTLTRSQVLGALQCAKRLWWEVHDSAAPELAPHPSRMGARANARRVRAAAHRFLGPGCELSGEASLEARIEATSQAIASSEARLYGATLSGGGMAIRVDVLDRLEDGWAITIIRPTTAIRQRSVQDLGAAMFAMHVLGHRVERAELLFLNKRATGPATQQLFQRVDLTTQAQDIAERLAANQETVRASLDGPLPECAVGPHCRKPRVCPFLSRCQPPPDPASTQQLYRLGKKRINVLLAAGHTTIPSIPADFVLPPIPRRQRTAWIKAGLFAEPTLGEALAEIRRPTVYIDFESIAPAIPRWADCRPFVPVPVQASCHHQDDSGTVTHASWLAPPGLDPRPALAAWVLAQCREAQTLVAYSVEFERRTLLKLCPHLPPEDRDAMRGLTDRFVDLQEVVRDQVYHPEFGGRFGLKSVVRALLPELAYDDLSVRDGSVASAMLEGLIAWDEPSDSGEVAALRERLLAYCNRDTAVLVALEAFLRAID